MALAVAVRDAEGGVLSEAPGACVPGKPVNAVAWLMSRGHVLKEADLIPVGSIGPLMAPPRAKGGASVTCVGLPGDPVVSVRFAD